jgi:hypothetical protein
MRPASRMSACQAAVWICMLQRIHVEMGQIDVKRGESREP